MNLLLFAPEYRPNMSSMIRSAEFYGLDKVYIYDKNNLLKPPTNKKGKSDMEHLARVWTAGAVDHISIEIIDDPVSFISSYEGRAVGTLISPEAVKIQDALCTSSDLLIMGPEKEGLPEEIVNLLSQGVWIPHKGNTDCLNVAVSCGIFLQHWATQTA